MTSKYLTKWKYYDKTSRQAIFVWLCYDPGYDGLFLVWVHFKNFDKSTFNKIPEKFLFLMYTNSIKIHFADQSLLYQPLYFYSKHTQFGILSSKQDWLNFQMKQNMIQISTNNKKIDSFIDFNINGWYLVSFAQIFFIY